MAKPEFYAACYGIIRNDKWETLFQKRANTWFRDGMYQLPSGHMEWKESMKECMKREMKEELGIDIQDSDLMLEHISHRVSKDRVYFDVYFSIKTYTWTLVNNELEKCSSIDFIDLENITEPELFEYDVDVINAIAKGEKFSDIIYA